MNSTQQILDRLAASTQDSIDALRKMNPEIANTSPEVSKACELIREADNSKHLLSSLHDVTNRGEVVDAKLRQVSTDLSAFIATHVAENMDMMINTSGSSCPSVTNETKLRAHLSSKTKLNAGASTAKNMKKTLNLSKFISSGLYFSISSLSRKRIP